MAELDSEAVGINLFNNNMLNDARANVFLLPHRLSPNALLMTPVNANRGWQQTLLSLRDSMRPA